MWRTMEASARAGVEISPHVALPDILGFGRRPMVISSADLRDYVIYQTGALLGFARAAGVSIGHVKPHGALYAMCGGNVDYATSLLAAVKAVDPSLMVILGGPAVAAAAISTGVRAVPEGYVDLAYQPNGFPVIERAKRAWDPADVAARAVSIVRDRRLKAVDDSTLTIDVPTICIHGDAPNALDVARAVRERLAAAGIEVVSLAKMMTDKL